MTLYAEEQSTRASAASSAFPTAYDDKEDDNSLKAKLAARKKPIYAGLAFLCVVVIGVSIGVSTGSSTSASTGSGESNNDLTSGANGTTAPAASTIGAEASVLGSVKSGTADSSITGDSSSTFTHASSASSASSAAGSNSSTSEDAGQSSKTNTTSSSTSTSTTTSPSPAPAPSPTPAPTTVAPTPAPTPAPTEAALPYSPVFFDWSSASNWEYSSGSTAASSIFTDGGLKLTPANSAQPIRSKQGWGGEKIVLIEWERSSTSDTNIWMLNTKLQNQFAAGNGWPYWGELDIFEMFTQDAIDKSAYNFAGNGGFSDVSSYGQLTMHMGPPTEKGSPCFCPAAASKSSWYQNTSPMTSGCTAQFANSGKNSIATVWGRDGTGQYIQLIQNPTVTKGGKKNSVDTYDVGTGSGAVTSKIYNNKDLFWGVPASSACASAGGHDATSGFPFFEDFRIILEEQKKSDASAWFKITNIQIFKKN